MNYYYTGYRFAINWVSPLLTTLAYLRQVRVKGSHKYQPVFNFTHTSHYLLHARAWGNRSEIYHCFTRSPASAAPCREEEWLCTHSSPQCPAPFKWIHQATSTSPTQPPSQRAVIYSIRTITAKYIYDNRK